MSGKSKRPDISAVRKVKLDCIDKNEFDHHWQYVCLAGAGLLLGCAGCLPHGLHGICYNLWQRVRHEEEYCLGWVAMNYAGWNQGSKDTNS